MIERFLKLVEVCRNLKAKQHIFAGVDFFITEDGKIAARTLKSDGNIPGEVFDADKILRNTSQKLQVVRHGLSTSFDISSEEWNNSNIGALLKYLSEKIRKELYKKEEAAKSGVEPLYNVFHHYDLTKVLADMGKVVLDKKFLRLSAQRQFKALNEFASKAIKELDQRRINLAIAAGAELMIQLGNLYNLKPGDPEVIKLIHGMVPSVEHQVSFIKNH